MMAEVFVQPLLQREKYSQLKMCEKLDQSENDQEQRTERDLVLDHCHDDTCFVACAQRRAADEAWVTWRLLEGVESGI
jgi:hypothetical protein